MPEFDDIFLSWRPGQGARRHIVGKLSRLGNSYVFEYFSSAVEKALGHGFSPYTEFPDYKARYNGNVLEVFAQRLTKSERPDIQKFYDFWEIKQKYILDKFYLLGHTQGLSPVDNFEFLADYYPVKDLSFITELAGLSKQSLSANTLNVGDELRFKLEPNNEFDPEAVRVFKDDIFVGYIKQIHCRVFHKSGAEMLTLKIKALEKNGIIKRVFVNVKMTS